MNKNIMTCPSCQSTLMTPLEAFEKEWEDTHEWEQDPDSSIYNMSISFICNRRHISIIRFLFDHNRIYHSLDVYSTQEMEGGMNRLLGQPIQEAKDLETYIDHQHDGVDFAEEE